MLSTTRLLLSMIAIVLAVTGCATTRTATNTNDGMPKHAQRQLDRVENMMSR